MPVGNAQDTTGVEYFTYRTARLTDHAATLERDQTGDLHEVLAAAAGVGVDNHVVFTVRDGNLLARIRELFNHPVPCRSATEWDELLRVANRPDEWDDATPRELATKFGYTPCGIDPEGDQLSVMFTDFTVHLGHEVVKKRW
jgi:hypothetical protein